MIPDRKEYRKQYYNKNKEDRIVKANKYYQENKEEVLKRGKQYYQENKEDKQWYWKTYKYNLTKEQYNTILLEQNNKCAICQDTLTKPHIDHCHTSGKVRAVLCSNCNTGIGKFKDDIDKLQRAIDYLNKYK